ncbi:MAG: hypothetical protein C4530_11425 [Desulfobacteraceae bacterium]|nr:MAG: hypothetical protein C4530_11425 [Desulfobacteraceae bacterium]
MRQDFDALQAEQRALIDAMSLSEVKIHREKLKAKLENIHMLMREEGIKDGRKKYLKGLRMATTNLLACTKERIATFNRVIYNGCEANFAKAFMDAAAAELDIAVFQRIYGLPATRCEIKAHRIEDVKRFVEESKKRLEDVNGNK